MESLDIALTYAIDLTMALGAGYIGTAFVFYMVDRWKQIEVKPKVRVGQKVNIPLSLKAADPVPLELEQQELAVAAIPLDPIITPAPERQELRTIEPIPIKEPDLLSAPKIPKPETSDETNDLESTEPDELEFTEPDELL